MYDYKAKEANVRQANKMTMSKTLSMFMWEGLPETIPQVELEKMLQINGYAFITEVDGKLYALQGGLGGVPDVYGNPTEIVVANPALRLNKTFNLNADGILILNDQLMLGTLPTIDKYNTFMAENDINLMVEGYNGRINTFISASDERTKQSADAFLEKIQDGEMAVIGESAMFDGVKSHSATQSGNITSLIELQQYHRATLFNELGMSSNFNMKRERLNSSEVQQNEDSTFPFVDNMRECRIEAAEKINEMFGTEIEVEYHSVWLNKSRERDVEEPSDETETGAGDEGSVGDSEDDLLAGDQVPEEEVDDSEDSTGSLIGRFNTDIERFIEEESQDEDVA